MDAGQSQVSVMETSCAILPRSLRASIWGETEASRSCTSKGANVKAAML